MNIFTGNFDFIHKMHEINHAAAAVLHPDDVFVPGQPFDHVVRQGLGEQGNIIQDVGYIDTVGDGFKILFDVFLG